MSIIVPVYNIRNYLSLCIDSIISQRHEDIEIILVDDGSDDGSELLCDQYSERFPHFIKVIHKANQGPLLARVDGFRMACGDYAMTVDSDDALLPGSLDSLIRAIQETDDDVIVWGGTRRTKTAYSPKPFPECLIIPSQASYLCSSYCVPLQAKTQCGVRQ